MSQMTSSRPYLLRSIYEWIVDNSLTPYIVVDAEAENVQVPESHVDSGRIILNISPDACRGLHLDNDRVVFSARFSGVAHQIHVPPLAVLAIYAKENGRGMMFGEDEDIDDDGGSNGDGSSPPALPPADGGGKKASRPKLKVVK